MPREMDREVKRVVMGYMTETFADDEYKMVAHFQRVEFFRAVVTYLHLFANIPERGILNFTVHALVQAMVDFKAKGANNEDFICIELEPCEDSVVRVSYKVPGWLLRAVATYFLQVRSHFMPLVGPGKFSRRWLGVDLPITTEVIFFNSHGNKAFRVATVSQQVTDAVRCQLHEHYE